MSANDPFLGLYCRPGYMNPGVVGNYEAGRVSLPSDTQAVARPLVMRVVRAYQRAAAEHQTPAPSLWEHAALQHQQFLNALTTGDVETAGAMLGTFFKSTLIWGLSRQPHEDASPDAVKAHGIWSGGRARQPRACGRRAARSVNRAGGSASSADGGSRRLRQAHRRDRERDRMRRFDLSSGGRQQRMEIR